MNKSELISAVAEATDETKSNVGKVLDAVLAKIGDSLKAGEEVALVGFGTWKKRTRAARKGRNPQTGAEINIPASNGVAFSAGKSLKDSVN